MPQNTTSELLPWLFLADNAARVVTCKDSSLLSAWDMTGIDIESNEVDALENAGLQLDGALRRVAEDGATVWAIVEREQATTYPSASFDVDVAAYIDQRWQ